MAPGQFLFRQLTRQQHSDLHPMYKSRPLMLPAEEAHWVDDLIHLLQRHPVHQLVQLMKSILDLSVRHGVALAVGFIEKVQNRIRVPQIRGMGVQAAAQAGLLPRRAHRRPDGAARHRRPVRRLQTPPDPHFQGRLARNEAPPAGSAVIFS